MCWILVALCMVTGRLYATEPYYGGTLVAVHGTEDMRIQKLRERDLSSPYHVSNRWRQHSYNTGHYSVAALFTDHVQCAQWSELDYAYALVTLCSQALPRGHRCALPSSVKPFCCDDKNIYYIDDAQRFNVFEQWKLYDYENFWKFIRHFSDYEQCICSVYDFFIKHPHYRQHLSPYALQRISRERDDIKRREQTRHMQQERQREQERLQQERAQQNVIQTTYQEYAAAIDTIQGDWHELCDVYDQYDLGNVAHLEKRIDALREINQEGAIYSCTSYNVDAEVARILKSCGCNEAEYKSCYGNQLQRVIHRECLDILGQVVSPSTPLIIEKDVVVDCVDAAREYNQSGLVQKACQVADMCWAMLDCSKKILESATLQVASGVQDIVQHPLEYGQAIVEGGLQGLFFAVEDILRHPVQAVACAIAGEYVLAYQLSKVACKLLDISVTSIFNRGHAREKWDDYIASLTAAINAITDKQMSLRDAMRNGTTLVVGWKAQGKLLNGVNKLYRNVKDKALEFMRKNPLFALEQYTMTADGRLMRATNNNFEPLKDVLHGSSQQAPQFSEEAIEASVKWAMHNNKVKHVFEKPRHGLDMLLQKMNVSQDELVGKVIRALVENHTLPLNGKFGSLHIYIAGYTIRVGGYVHDGIVKLGTFFIPDR